MLLLVLSDIVLSNKSGHYHCTPMSAGISRLNKTPEGNFAVETLY